MRLVAITLCKLFTSLRLIAIQFINSTNHATHLNSNYDNNNVNGLNHEKQYSVLLNCFQQYKSFEMLKSHFLVGGCKQVEQLLILSGFKSGINNMSI